MPRFDPSVSRPTLRDVQEASSRVRLGIHRTPILTSAATNGRTQARVSFKCENFQKTGSFKIRGALNAVLSLDDAQAAPGVVTHSSGNHAAALAMAARLRGIPAYIVMPSNSPAVKQAAVAGYGGQITLCEPTLSERERTAAEVIRRTGATLVHPYNDFRIIAGQGTAALELMESQAADPLHAILVPVGGGGLLSGTLIAAKGLSAATKVIGCEPAAADDAFRSWQASQLIPLERTDTIADGLRTSLGDKTFPIIQELVDQIVTVSESSICETLRWVMERMKIVVEPSAVVPLAALFEHGSMFAGQNVGIILSGGNVDLSRLPLSA